jgi:lipopolysaccharide/colanic/teichoic acid biosynthesis glycosyltransferase
MQMRVTIKRIFDFLLALCSLIILLPVFLLISIFVRKKLGTPVLFKQHRPGKNAEMFTMYKFRTMINSRDSRGEFLPDSQRLTNFGRFIRSTSLDELPEIYNVLKGEMSFVGPRPLLEKYLPFYSETENMRHDVRPGITGWAQINGRNNLSWDKRLELDVWYVKNQSFWLDLKILFLTLVKVFRREDVIVDAGSSVIDFDEERKAKLEN